MNYHLDENIVLQFRQGNPIAFRQVFDAFYRSLYYFTFKLTGNQTEAEEICLNSFMKIFEGCASFETAGSIKAFLFKVARNNSIDFLRSHNIQKEKQARFVADMQDDYVLQMEYEIKDVLIEKVRAAINELPDECRRVFKMLYYEELSPAEVAEILKVSVSTVYNQKSRAIKTLRLSLNYSVLGIWSMITAGL
ncbi:RNA polymerase sigma factor [Chitinophaga tropicalis]|uniref:Sigma-70 family RNA polymerase sigma factor n=1 Tax=Chitinophaga tropicalis TaxID=2683588 RepID=A0A7K1U0C0_9BACT|nr:sigma-70 family RNA polymerase sigma factor [Chitinophaga tropicalis]MVT07746.1 sigma-70 family RNA polymerase sigma factor [Chitinophaga tropicalis]